MALFPKWRFRPDFAPIAGFVGANRSGKSALAQHLVLNLAAREGVPVWSNIALKREGVEVNRITGLVDLSKISSAIVFLDDIASVAPARESMSSPPDLVFRLMSLGHRDSLLYWTSPMMSDVDIAIRKVTQQVIAVRPLIRRRIEGQLWPRTLLAYAKTYDTLGERVTDIDANTPKGRHGFVRLSELNLDQYDTREELEPLYDHAMCPNCGLRRRREYCTGKHASTSTPVALDLTPD